MFDDGAVKINCNLNVVNINHHQPVCGAKFNQIGIITEIYLNFNSFWKSNEGMKHIPNFITSLNLASGFVAILFTINNDLVTGFMVNSCSDDIDFLDGFSARLLNSYSDIGKELDSLADVVSFGVAPALIISVFSKHLLQYRLNLMQVTRQQH